MLIITNNCERKFKYGYEVPQKILDDYDHLSDDEKTDGWIFYRNSWYHLTDFMSFNREDSYSVETGLINSDKWDWHGYVSNSYFSGVYIHISDDGETYKIATYIS